MKALLLAGLLGVGSVGAAAPTAVPAARVTPARVVTHVALALPLLHQTWNACGPTSLAMILGFWGQSVAPAVISPFVRPNERAYMPVGTVAPFVARYGLQTMVVRNATVNTVRALLALGIPSLLLSDLQTPGLVAHWRVATGFDDRAGVMLFHDPLKGYVSISYEGVAALWAGHQGLMVVIAPPGMSGAIAQRLRS